MFLTLTCYLSPFDGPKFQDMQQQFRQSLRDSWYRVLGVVVPSVDVGSLDVVVASTVVVASVVVVICVVGSSVVVAIEVVVSSVVDVTTVNGAQTNNCICYYLSRDLY